MNAGGGGAGASCEAALAEVMEASGLQGLCVLAPADGVAVARDAADASSSGLSIQPALGPGGGKAQHQFKVFASCQTPLIPAFTGWPVLRSRQPGLRQFSAATTAAAEFLRLNSMGKIKTFSGLFGCFWLFLVFFTFVRFLTFGLFWHQF